MPRLDWYVLTADSSILSGLSWVASIGSCVLGEIGREGETAVFSHSATNQPPPKYPISTTAPNHVGRELQMQSVMALLRLFDDHIIKNNLCPWFAKSPGIQSNRSGPIGVVGGF